MDDNYWSYASTASVSSLNFQNYDPREFGTPFN